MTSPSHHGTVDATPQPHDQKKQDSLPHDDTVTIAATEYERLMREAAEYLDGWKRAKADYLNLKRETEARQGEFIQFAVGGVLKQLIPIYDHLMLACAGIPQDRKDDPWVDGVRKIMQEFETMLHDAGVAKMETIGTSFDPERHEALGYEARPGSAPHTVVREMKPGYTFHGRVFIPAQVMISTHEGADHAQEEHAHKKVENPNDKPLSQVHSQTPIL